MRNKLKLLGSSVRYLEALIFLTPAMMGLAVFLPELRLSGVVEAALVCTGSFFVAAAILAVNDWADIGLDSQNSLKRDGTFLQRGIAPNQVLALAISLAAGGLLLFAAVSRLHVVMALAWFGLGLAYSVPVGGRSGKSIPIFSSFLHFGGTLLSFLLGALTFAPTDWRGLLIASHPAILITAGHLVQEIEDYEEDRLSGLRTNPVRFGRIPVFIIAAVLFGLSFWLLFWLTDAGFLPPFVRYTAALYPVYLALALRAFRAGLTRLSVRRLRAQYRILFAVVVLVMLIGSLWQRGLLS